MILLRKEFLRIEVESMRVFYLIMGYVFVSKKILKFKNKFIKYVYKV